MLDGLIRDMTKRGVTNDAEDKWCAVQNPPQDRRAAEQPGPERLVEVLSASALQGQVYSKCPVMSNPLQKQNTQRLLQKTGVTSSQSQRTMGT